MKVLKEIFSRDMIGTWILCLFFWGAIWGITLLHYATKLEREVEALSKCATIKQTNEPHKNIEPPFIIPEATSVHDTNLVYK